MHSRAVRFCLLLSVTIVIAYSACSEKRDSISVDQISQATRPVLDPRPNPLREYIQDTWVNGSSTATGGGHYPHIKIFGFSHANLVGYQEDADFIAEHFDMYMWGGPIVGAASASLNPGMLWLHEAGNIPSIRAGWDSSMVSDWIGLTPADTCIHGNPRPGNNAQGYGWDDILLLYKFNTNNGVSTIPGWNPADDTDGDGCIEPNEGNGGQPSLPNRSAQDYYDACVVLQISPTKAWRLGDVVSPGYIASEANTALWEYDTYGVEGYHFDEAAYQPSALGLGNTFRYEGLDPYALDFPYQTDKIAFVRSVMDIVEAEGAPAIVAPNMVNSSYTCDFETQQTAALAYLENMLLEIWISTNTVTPQPANTSKRAALLECPQLDYFPQDKGMILTCYDPGASERGKLFSLGMFYMINHQLTFYYYRTNFHDGHNVDETQWNPWVEYDVGQPVVNDLDLDDFQGNSGTDKFFVFEDGSTYQLLGRQFLRSDGKRILVLVKLMDYGQSEGGSSVNHALGASYKRLQSNFTWSPASSSVSMTNNSGVILLRQSGQGCHGCEPEG